ncbi:MAG: DNA-binding protein [Proteobacteria bacterium]|nr:DNA-binding protein [Pseudomonadota bacterium]
MDTYGTSDAARVLGVSPKRVRQMVAAGTLAAVEMNPLRIEQAAVHALRDKRRSDKRAKAAPPEPPPAADLMALVEQLLDMQRQATEAQTRLEITSSAADEMRAERDALASEVADLRAQLARRRRGLFRRG